VRRRLPLAVMIVAIIALGLPILFGRSLWLRDLDTYFYPEKLLLGARLCAGQLPLWNPFLEGGLPELARLQPGVLYPGNLILLLGRPLGVDLFLLVHLVIAGLGARRWLLGRDCDPLAAAFGGLAFAASGFLVAMFAGNGHYLIGAAWLPWALRGRAASIAAAVALAFVAGDPQAAWLAVGLAALQALVDRRGLGQVAAGALLAGVIPLPLVLAGLETASVGRPHLELTEASHFSLHPLRLVELLWPGAFGEPHTPSWNIHRMYDEGTGLSFEPLASSIYMGLAVPWLAALALCRRRPAAFDALLAVLVGAGVAIALGRHTPIFALFFRWVPGAGWFRYPEKYFLVVTLALAGLAARGLGRAAVEPRRAVGIGAGLVVVLAAGLGALPADAGRRALAVGVALVGAMALSIRRPAARGLFAAVAAVELVAASLALVRWVPSEAYRARSPVVADLDAVDPDRPHRLYRTANRGEMPGDDHDPWAQRMTLLPNAGIEDGIDHTHAYTAFPIPGDGELAALAPVRRLQVLATRFALLGADQLGAHPAPELTVRRTYPALGAALVELAGAAPRVYLATDARHAEDAADAARLAGAADFVPGATVAVEGPARRAAGACVLASDRIERLELRCQASAPTYAVVADTFFPGWSARVDGEPAPILRANATQRAVPVPAGASEVVLSYRPRGWPWSLAASALGIVALLFSALVPHRRPVQEERHRGEQEA
jgi:hypothetical protein